MKFMILVIPKDYAKTPPGTKPDPKDVAKMAPYNKQLADAGILVDLNGLHPQSEGARVTFPGGKPTVTDGPFAESKEVFGGYWIIEVKSKREAIDWATKIPGEDGDTFEIREVQGGDFPTLKARHD